MHEEGHGGHVHAAVLLLGADQHEGIGVGEGRRLVDGDVFHTVIVLSESSTMLTTSLRELERDGLVSRVQFNEIPPRVEYSLTEKGRALLPVFYEMTRWGFRYIPCGRLCKNAALSCGIFVIHLFFNTFWSE
ncbi:MAG: winged helix-turn-helix transcriptional regulator [Oscillospiraceae bacterium]|nr:winged helix-turn-helix transcriptional regulator [Oscillospiraceae bacterium]